SSFFDRLERLHQTSAHMRDLRRLQGHEAGAINHFLRTDERPFDLSDQANQDFLFNIRMDHPNLLSLEAKDRQHNAVGGLWRKPHFPSVFSKTANLAVFEKTSVFFAKTAKAGLAAFEFFQEISKDRQGYVSSESLAVFAGGETIHSPSPP